MTTHYERMNSPMTILDWVSLLWKLPYIVIGTLFTFALQSLPSHPSFWLNWRQKLGAAAVHMLTTTLSHSQTYAFLNRKTTGTQIRLYCKFWRMPHRQVSVPMPETAINPVDGSALMSPTLHFVSVPRATPDGPTVFYCHGGGFLHAMVYRGHMAIGLHLAKSCKASKLVFFEYTLTPYSHYPGQLNQLIEATRYLIEQEGISPDDLIVGGDSAGGHLTTSLLAHITTPAPTVPPLDLQGKQLRAAVLISPWLDMAGSGSTARGNEGYDYVSQKMLIALSTIFRTNPEHVWSEPMNAPSAKALWAKAFPKNKSSKAVVKRLILTAGEHEVLFDSCVKFATDLIAAEIVYMDGKKDTIRRIQQASVVLVVGPMEVHVQCALDLALQYRSGATVVAMKSFFESV